jgi:cellulose synthase/poly-beta-1,6-N-acetylglucosamine synthase-like glycosyltransferase
MIDPRFAPIFLTVMYLVVITAFFWMSIYIIKRKSINKNSKMGNFFPKISIIVPAYNEEKNIGNTLKSIFRSKYPKKKMEVLVIDDHSTDRTASIVKKFNAKLITLKKHMGKIAALNKGIENANGKIIVTMDADSELKPRTLNLLIQKFKDPKIGAVSGTYKSKPNSHKNWFYFLMEKLQSLEYLGFTLIRKQQEVLESILVVPGAIGAYRKEALKKVGGFDNDTLIEDYDVTLKIHKVGYKVRCDKNALCYVSPPPNLTSFLRQRTRWYRGGLQTLRKHFDIFHTRLGTVAFVWGFEVLGMILQFIVFSIFIGSAISNAAFLSLFNFLAFLKIWLMNILAFNTLGMIFAVGFILITLGFINTAISIKLTKDSKKKLLLYPLMTVYSSFLFLIFFKSFLQELFRVKSVWLKSDL